MTETVVGLKELHAKLMKLGPAAGGKTLRSAATFSTTPVIRKARSRIPVGTKVHKTYRGRYVSPGFASRNVAKANTLSRDKTTAWSSVGVRAEAFYAVNFVELPRRATKVGDKRKHKRGSSPGRMIKPQRWLQPSFESSQQIMLERLKTKLRRSIDKAAK